MKFLIKDIVIRTLNTGDKQGRVTLETLNPEDTAVLAVLHDKREIEVNFVVDNEREKV